MRLVIHLWNFKSIRRNFAKVVYVLSYLIPTRFRDLLHIELVVKTILTLECALSLVDGLKDLRPKFSCLVSVMDVPKLVLVTKPKVLARLVQPDDADRAEHALHVNEAAAKIGKKPLFNVPFDDIALGVKRLAGGPSLLVNQAKERVCVSGFVGQAGQIDRVDLNRPNLQRGAPDGVTPTDRNIL